MATHRKMDSEDQETLFNSYPCAYYVQSPSTISHANSSELKTHVESTFHSPSRSSDTAILLHKNPHHHDHDHDHVQVSRFTTLSRYSSSRGSNNSFLNDKKLQLVDGGVGVGSAGAGHDLDIINGVNRLIIVDRRGIGEEGDEDDPDDEYYYGRKGGFWWRYCSFRRSSSCAWVSLQISWRLLVSLGVALLVFYIATKPPPPTMSIKMAGMREFGLGEGVDGSGVTTKILTCNCSLHLVVDNKSKLFGLYIQPPLLQMFFGRLPFAISRGSKLYAESHGPTRFELNVGTRNKPMYGAGRNMQDLLESGNGLPILIRLTFTSHFKVVSHLIKPKFHHQAQCLILLHDKYDNLHRTQAFNSTCSFI